MTKGANTNPKEHTNDFIEEKNRYSLILHNDDVNSFEYVIKSLVEICKHNGEQAEQCAYITHYKGACDIKMGIQEILKPLRDSLRMRGLSVTIE